MKTMNNQQQAGEILTKAEAIKAVEKKLRKGGEVTREDLQVCTKINGELLFGYDEKTRLKRLHDVEAMLQKELD